ERPYVFGPEPLAPFGDDPGPGACGDEHADSPLLVEDSLVDEDVHAFAGRGRVDAMERRELVGRRYLGLLGKRSAEDVVLDLLGELKEDRPVLVHAVPPLGQLVSYSTN